MAARVLFGFTCSPQQTCGKVMRLQIRIHEIEKELLGQTLWSDASARGFGFEVRDYCRPIYQADPGAVDSVPTVDFEALSPFQSWKSHGTCRAWPGVGAQEAASRRTDVQGRRPRGMRDLKATELGVALKKASL